MAQGGINQVNTGRDVTLNVVSPSGTFELNITQSFRRTAMFDRRESRPINGSPQFIDIPKGWEIRFELDRQDATVDEFFASQESAYYSGAAINASSISEQLISAIDGSVSVFLYSGLMLTLDDAGDVKADDVIKMTVSGRAATRVQLS